MRTSLIRWSPFAELDDLPRQMEEIFAEIAGEPRMASDDERTWAPAVDVHRDDGKLIVRADLPGFKPEEIKVEFEGDTLTVSGEHEESSEEKERDFLRRERHYGAFRRSLVLPAEVDRDAIEAVSHDGVLEVSVPMPPEKDPAARRVITPTPA
jgi:HSP20 family protein